MREFYAVTGFPEAIGALDGCHFPVSPPKKHAMDYYNYKGCVLFDMVPPCKKRKFLSLEDKARILAEVASGQKKANVLEKFGISPSSLSTILKFKEAIEQALASGTSAKQKKPTPSAQEKLDKAMHTWFVETSAKKIPISGNAVQQKALNYACLLGIDDF
ncbi:hypothetical protein HPB49_002820 [Dermacentor silvarum]|uniref:Uncharacterized protein n=1 Tax=Dermacentor silvarum TaxID=543639 RepID=A0ACB8CPD1_DERSI|nr:hypothetical protein HPB49_002820 [Dermacentor silvarum]